MSRVTLPLRVEPASVTAAGIDAEVVSQGVMLCLKPPAILAERIAVASGDKPEQLHVTILYFGAMNEVDMPSIERLALKLPWIAANLPQIGVGFNRIERLGPKSATVLAGENGSLMRWREYLTTTLRDYVKWNETYAFYPHMTLGYWPEGEGPDAGPYDEAVSWVAESMYLSVGPAITNFPFDNETSETADQWAFGYEELVNRNHTPTSAHPNAVSWKKEVAGRYSFGTAIVEQVHSRAFGSHWVMRVDGKRIDVAGGVSTLRGAQQAVEGYLHGQADTPDQTRMSPAAAPLYAQTDYHRGFVHGKGSDSAQSVSVPMPVTTNPKYKFKFKAERNDYEQGDDRAYRVSHRGITIGTVETTWIPSRVADGEPTQGWDFESYDGKMRGTGKSRGEAVANAIKDAQAKSEGGSDATTASADSTLSIRVR